MSRGEETGDVGGTDPGGVRDPSALAETTWPQVSAADVLLVPVGSTEQHGPHLPLDTDTCIARGVCDALAARMREAGRPVWVGPPLAYASSGEHQGFPGTVSIGTEVLVQIVVELVRSARTWARRVVFVNAHGGNVAALTRATDLLVEQGHDVAWLPCRAQASDLPRARERSTASARPEASDAPATTAVPTSRQPPPGAFDLPPPQLPPVPGPSTTSDLSETPKNSENSDASSTTAMLPASLTDPSDLHAGRTETSLLLHLRPGSVRTELATVGDTRPLTQILPTLMSDGVAAVSPNGVLGDPTGASAAEGAEILAAMVEELVGRVLPAEAVSS